MVDTDVKLTPYDFPVPCQCRVCAKETVCHCRSYSTTFASTKEIV